MPLFSLRVAYLAQVRAGCLLPHRLPIGLKEQIQKWTSIDLLSFYRRHYRPEAMRLYMVGPLPDAEAAFKAAETYFGNAPANVRVPVR